MKEKGSVSPKLLTYIKNLVCIVIIAVILAMSFGTIFTMKAPTEGKAVEVFDKIINSVGDGDSVSMPDKVDISIPFLVKSVGSAGKVIKSAFSTLNSAQNASDALNDAQSDIENDPSSIEDAKSDIDENIDDLKKNTNELSENLRDETFVGFVTFIAAIVGAFSENIFLALIYIALIFLVISFPTTIAVRLIISIVSYVIHIANPSAAVNTVSKSYRTVISLFPLLLLIKMVAPAVAFTSSVIVMALLLALGVVLGVVISRLRKYTPAQLKYINLVQLMSAVALIGYVLFLAGFSKLGLFDALWSEIPKFFKSASAANIFIALVLIVAMIVLLILAFKHIKNIACRLACMLPTPKAKKKKPIKKFAKDTYIPTAAASVALVVIPFVLPIVGFNFNMGNGIASFALFALGLGIMFIAEILMMALKKPLCAGLTPEDVKSVLSGYTDPENEAVTTESTLENDTAEEASAEAEAVITEQISEESVPLEEADEESEASEDTVTEPVEANEEASAPTESEAPEESETETAVNIELTPDEDEVKAN